MKQIVNAGWGDGTPFSIFTNYGYNREYNDAWTPWRKLSRVINPTKKHIIMDINCVSVGYAWYSEWNVATPSLTGRHTGGTKTNVLYLDGHVETHDSIAAGGVGGLLWSQYFPTR
jgi:prepilin-type processing-associated H-X9-DG protein